MDAQTPKSSVDDDALARAESEPNKTLTARLRALAHPIRLEVLRTLSQHERCVCGQIVRALPLAQSTVSEHLRVLLSAGLITGRTEGHRSCYCLNRETMRALKDELGHLFTALLAQPQERSTQDAH